MKYYILKEQLRDFIVFSMSDIRKIETNFHRRQLSSWQKKGYIKKIRRGYYMFSDTSLNEETLFLIANRLYSPSYVSLESALSYYGLIPEGVYSITSVSGKKTSNFNTPLSEFIYRKISPRLLFGYNLKKQGNQSFKIAEIEKAVLDYLYLNPQIVQDSNFYEWRFNSQEFLFKADIEKLYKYGKEFKNKNLLKRLKRLLELMEKNK